MEKFQAIAITIDNANEHELLHGFTQQIKDHGLDEVRLRKPKDMEEAAKMALDFDELLHPPQQQQSR